MRTSLRRKVVCLFLLTLFVIALEERFAFTVSAMPLQCDEDVCTNSSVDCDEECGVGWTMYTCATYIATAHSGECNYGAWDSCNWMCGPSAACNTSCTSMGSNTTCGSLTNMCTDPSNGVCEPGENCNNSQDCACPPNDTNMDDDIINEIGPGTDLGSSCTVADIMASDYHVIPSNYDCDSVNVEMYYGITCGARQEALDQLSELQFALAAWYAFAPSNLKGQIEDLMDTVWSAREEVQSFSCNPLL